MVSILLWIPTPCVYIVLGSPCAYCFWFSGGQVLPGFLIYNPTSPSAPTHFVIAPCAYICVYILPFSLSSEYYTVNYLVFRTVVRNMRGLASPPPNIILFTPCGFLFWGGGVWWWCGWWLGFSKKIIVLEMGYERFTYNLAYFLYSVCVICKVLVYWLRKSQRFGSFIAKFSILMQFGWMICMFIFWHGFCVWWDLCMGFKKIP